jgi:mono/diheme cytochrome c family protein
MVRGTNGGFYRFQPQRKHLERTAQLSIPNPWGIAFDDWGQPIFAETSGPAVRWMLPGTVKSRYGVATHKSKDLIPEENKVRPTSGLEFVSSRHFPDEVQGDLILANSIGFLGMRQHKINDEGAGYSTDLRHDIIKGDDPNFRPVDMEFAPDGSLYFVDWHNVLIGHMQHNARDPYRDHVHGRIYRITYPARPLVDAPKVAGASIDELLENLKLPEYRARYRTRRELRGRESGKVISALETWVDDLDTDSENYERYLMEAMWVYWGLNESNESLLEKLMNAKDYRARAAAARYVRYNGHLLDDQVTLLNAAAEDDHDRVRLEAITAASWLDKESAMQILSTAGKYPLDDWLVHAHQTAVAHVNGVSLEPVKKEDKMAPTDLTKAQMVLYEKGEEIYLQDGYCGTCHQENGKGLAATGYPPLVGAKWVLGNPERLVKLTLKGLYGPIRVKSVDYPGNVPMTPYEGLLDDEEIASVLTYVRNSFGNKASAIKPEFVAKVRRDVKDKKGFYDPKDLLAEHPFE